MSKFVLTAQLQLQAPNNVSQIVSQIQNQLNNVSVNVQVKGSAQANQQLQQITQSTQAATTAASRMGNAFAISIRRFAAFSIATRAVGLFTSTLADAVKTAIDFEREVVKISQVTGRSVSDLRDLTDAVTNLSTGLGVTSQSLLEVTTVLTQAGLSSEDTKIALESLAKAALAPNFDSITETAEGAIAILAQFKQGVGALEGQLSSIDAVAGAFAVEAGDLIDVIRRSGGVFKASGGSLNELLALFTSVRATTRESAESIGTGLRTIFTRIQRPETIEFLKQFGVELVDLNGKFVGPYEAIKRLSEAISGLGEGDLTFIKIAEELGGFRQIGKVLPLLQQFSTAQAALNVAQNAGNGLTTNAIAAQASLAIRILKVREEFLALIRSMTETPTFQIMANTALALASALIKIADSIKPLIPLLAAVAAFKAVKGIGSFIGGIGAGLQSGRTLNAGGKVLAFAKGGLVPGSGSGTADDVPAMVSSGEFVMKKSAVQRVGANNLAAMNRGGVAHRFAIGGKVGAIALKPMDSSQTATATITTANILNALATNNQLPGGTSGNQALIGKTGDFLDSSGSKTGLSKRREAPDGLTFKQRTERLVSKIAFNNRKGSQKITAVGESFPSTKNSETPIEESIKKSITNAYNAIIPETANQLQALVGPGVTAGKPNPSIVSSIGVDDAAGKIFEGAVSSLGAPFDSNNQKGDRDAFDFPRGIGSNLAQFSKFTELKSIPTDAKKSLDGNLQDIASRKTTNFLAGQVNQSGAFQQLKARAIAAKGVDVEKSPKGPRVKKNFGGLIQKFAIGGRAKGIQDAPLVDDILQASGSILPRPSTAIQALIKAGGGAVDVDRTLKRTIGDTAYAKAPTPGAKNASLDTYFRDEAKRLQDLKTAPMTQFGVELQAAIKNGQLNARKISIISKSKRVKGAAEYLSSQFGIPIQNMVFTQGGSKQPAMDAIRNKGSRVDRVRKFFGGMVQKFAVGGKPDPRKSLENYFADSSTMNLGLANSKGLNKDQRTALASDVRNLRQLRTPAPATLYSSISRVAFDKMASQVGFNKAPTIPEGTKYNDIEKILDKEAKSTVGKSFSLPGFVSTSKDYSKAKTFLDNAPRASDSWAAMLTIATKKNAKGVDVEKQLSGRKLNITKQDINPRTGKMETMYMKPPSSEEEVMLQPRSRFRINEARAIKLGTQKNLWATAQQFAAGGMVPGVGNGDTVPAVLNEGAFVIRKSSVSKLGAENLASMAGYAAGGNVAKSVPALLTPGEFVFDEPSAKSIGYGNLNRMNKVGKYAKGGFVGVQKFAAGSSGTGAKGVGAPIGATGGLLNLDIGDKIVKDLNLRSTGDLLRAKLMAIPILLMGGGKAFSGEMFGLVNQLDYLDTQVSGLAKAVIANGEANKRSVQGQAALISNMRDMNFNQLQVFKGKLEADTAAITGNATAAAVTSPTSPGTATSGSSNKSPGNATAAAVSQASAFQESALASMSPKDAAMTQVSMKKNTVVYDQLAIELEKMSLETKDSNAAFVSLRRSLDKGLPLQDAYNKAIESASASASKSGKITRDVATPQSSSEKFKAASSPLEKQQIYMEAKASKGTLTNKDVGSGLGAGMSQAQAKAIIATNQQAASSQKATQANLQEASASSKAAEADLKESMSSAGGAKDFGGLAMGISLVSGTLQSLLPPIDETSSIFLKMTSGGLTLLTTLAGVAFSLSAFGINLNTDTIASAASAAASFLQGTAGATAAAATTALAGTAGASSLALTGMSATSGFATASLLKLAASALRAAQNMLLGIGKFVGPLVNAAGPLLSFAAGGALAATGLNLLVSEIYGVSDKLKKSISEGNVEQAGKLAGTQYDVDAGNVTRMVAGVVTAVGVGLGTTLGAALGTFAGPVVGNIAGGIIGGLAGAAVATALINTFSGVAENINVLFGGNTRDSTIALAQAQAQAVSTQKALTASGENATKAMTDLQNGTISAAQAVAATGGGGDAVLKENQINKKAAEENEKNKSGTLGGIARGALRVGTLGLAGYMGVESGAQRNARIDTENKGMSQQSKKSQETLIQQSTPAINALSGDIAAAGGTFEDVMAQIQATNPGLYFSLISQGSGELAKSFDNIKKEVERAQKAFNAMNLGMQNVQGAAAAAALGVNNYVASQQAGNIGLEQSLAVLEAGVTSAAQGISDADFGKALSDADATLANFGASKEQRDKFSGNISAVNEVQKNQSTIFAGAKDKLATDIRKSNSADERKKIFSQTVDDQLKASGYDEATRTRFKDATGNMSDDQLKKIGEGDFTAFEESINELGKKTMEQVSGPLKAAIEIQKQLNELTKQRIEAERQLVSAQLEASNVRMEAMDIAAQYGGPKVTPEMRAQNIAQQANIQSRGIKGVSDIKTGSAQELSTRTQQLSSRQAEIASIRTQAAAGDSAAQQQLQGEGGLKLQEEEKKIQDAAKSQVQATRDLIKSKQEELKLIKEKNQLEKSSIDALVSGDIEKFFDQQAAVGAQAAIATGDQRLVGQFGMSAIGGAAQETRRQQEAGVQELYGQKLSGPGGLTERAYGSAISAAGIQNPLAMAQVAAGSTGAEAAVESDIRDLAATMGPAADVQVEAANNQVIAAQMQLDAAKVKGEEAVSQMQARQMATGGVVYASRGIFVPRGTDTVPAMLTPGEFVVRRQAVQRNNNLSILQAMNKGVSTSATSSSAQSGGVAAMANGGIVRYRDGGSTGPESGGVGISAEALNSFAAALSHFNTELTKNITTLTNTKFQVTLNPTNINVNLTGTSFLANLTSSIKQDLLKFLGQEISKYSVGNDGKLRENGSTLDRVT